MESLALFAPKKTWRTKGHRIHVSPQPNHFSSTLLRIDSKISRTIRKELGPHVRRYELCIREIIQSGYDIRALSQMHRPRHR